MDDNQKCLNRILDETRNSLPEPKPEWPHDVKRALSCIQKYLFDQRLTVRWMKEQCHLNGSNFSGRFAFYVGSSPQQFITKHRITMAKSILKEPALAKVSITHIALFLGFNSHSSFTKTFTRRVGKAPNLFRSF